MSGTDLMVLIRALRDSSRYRVAVTSGYAWSESRDDGSTTLNMRISVDSDLFTEFVESSGQAESVSVVGPWAEAGPLSSAGYAVV